MPHFEEEAKARQGQRTDLSANLRGSSYGKASDKAAETLNVSPRSVENAKKVLREATPELVAAMEEGTAKVSVAAEVASLPPEQQREIVARGRHCKGVAKRYPLPPKG